MYKKGVRTILEQTSKETRLWVLIPLLKELKNNYPEARGMTFTKEVDWALRKLIEAAKAGKECD